MSENVLIKLSSNRYSTKFLWYASVARLLEYHSKNDERDILQRRAEQGFYVYMNAWDAYLTALVKKFPPVDKA